MAKNRRSTYHHGDVRNAALHAARLLLTRSGVGALSLRRVASAIGVSPMALYNHFEDKEELLVALAESGLEALRTAILEAAPSDFEPLERLSRGAVAYVLFAVENRAEFELIFGGVSSAYARHAELRTSAAAAFDTLRACLAECAEANLLKGDPIAAERAIWSAAHGYASLWNSVPQLMRGDRSQVAENARSMIDVILQGLAA